MTVLVLAEHDGQHLKATTLQAISAARQFGGEVHVLVAGNQPAAVVAAVQQLDGVAKVLVADAPHLVQPLAVDLAPVVVAAAAGYRAVLGGHSAFSRDVLPRIAALLGVAMISDVLEIIDGQTFKRPIYAGNLVATVQSADPVAVLTVRGSRFTPAVAAATPTATVENLQVAAQGSGLSTWLAENKSQSERPELSTARIVISGGRSLGSEEKFQNVLGPLAAKLNAAIGASRAAVDAGYAPNDAQVGQTGTQVAPDLYMAFGISGSIQHTAGIKDSKIIVAVNIDPDAPIFQVADYGIVADLFSVAPQLEQAF